VPTPQASTIINNSSPSLRDTFISWAAKPDGAALTKNEATLQQGLGYGIMALGAAGIFSGQAVLVGIPVMGAGAIVVGKGIEGIKVFPEAAYIQVLSPIIGTVGEIPLVNPFP
jgi:hypothetical protein